MKRGGLYSPTHRNAFSQAEAERRALYRQRAQMEPYSFDQPDPLYLPYP